MPVILIFCVLFLLNTTGCSEEETVRPEKKTFAYDVANLKAETSYGKIRLTWEMPDAAEVDKIQLMMKLNLVGTSVSFLPYRTIKPTNCFEFALENLADVTMKVILIGKDKSKSRGVSIQAIVPHPRVIRDTIDGRQLFIYLPEGYDTEKTIYPVIYFFDGQNLFSTKTGSAAEWKVDEVVDRLIAEKKIPKLVVVGISHSGATRRQEYTPYRISNMNNYGDTHAEFLVSKLIPEVEKKYRVSRNREDRAIMGSSMGGLMSFWMIRTYPDFFSTAGIFSPYAPWIGDDVAALKRQDIRMYFDNGTAELGTYDMNYLQHTRQYMNSLWNNKYDFSKNVLYYEVPHSAHHETEWTKRVGYAILLFKGNQKGKVTNMTVNVESLEHPYDDVNLIVNPVVDLDNGWRYSLYRQAQYSVIGVSKATVDETGVVHLNGEKSAEIKVVFEGFEQTVTVP